MPLAENVGETVRFHSVQTARSQCIAAIVLEKRMGESECILVGVEIPVAHLLVIDRLLVRRGCFQLCAIRAEKIVRFRSVQRARNQFIAAIVSV